MRLNRTWLHISLIIFLFAMNHLAAQELEPNAYSLSPTGVNLFLATYNHSGGDLTFDPALPIEDANARINTAAIGYGRTFGLGGRLAQVGIAVPYSVGRLEGLYIGEYAKAHRSGLKDAAVRFAVNLVGAPAMGLKEFASFRRKTILGLSLSVVSPLGQYSPGRIINIGTNRWSFKPELGLSHAAGKWTLDVYAGVWLFTPNSNFSNGKQRTQDPIGSFQFHLIRTLRPRMWIAFDSNYYTGGRTSVNGVINQDLQRNSRIGATFAVPLARRHGLKFSFSRGAYTTVGADFHAFGVAYQYTWGGGL
jgi:hypothetical protein